jgi:hypothetical protein
MVAYLRRSVSDRLRIEAIDAGRKVLADRPSILTKTLVALGV